MPPWPRPACFTCAFLCPPHTPPERPSLCDSWLACLFPYCAISPLRMEFSPLFPAPDIEPRFIIVQQMFVEWMNKINEHVNELVMRRNLRHGKNEKRMEACMSLYLGLRSVWTQAGFSFRTYHGIWALSLTGLGWGSLWDSMFPFMKWD